MKMALAFLLNFIVPGLGNLILGYWGQGALQLVVTLISFVLVLTVWLTFFGLVIFGFVWLYALVLWFVHLRKQKADRTSVSLSEMNK